MKHITICSICTNKSKEGYKPVYAVGEIDSNLMAVCTCSKGHKTLTVLMGDLFDVLYTSAMYAFIRGCYSESVMSFTASLERTYEFFLKVIMIKEGISMETIDEFWKELKNQSERQYGAFCCQYVKITDRPWRIDSNKVKFRNSVIHKGHIATREEVIDYADYTTQLQMKILGILKFDFYEEYGKLYFHEKKRTLSARKKIFEENENIQFNQSSHLSLFRWNDHDVKNVTFEEALKMMKQFDIGW
ncbi:hypothetical protein [uncultured Aquimarina sp.]|uniref:hypothetical protein n=1 Tax=uncultured Aquimarina sp. TaxID=575652 RepID=UPI00262B7D2B|nr:hypothetical protein [uncultured Aquimarina sp.]